MECLIQCDGCELWPCLECEIIRSMNQMQYIVKATKLEGVSWLCRTCRPTMKEVRDDLFNIGERDINILKNEKKINRRKV